MTFSSKDLRQYSGASKRQINYWTQLGILQPLNPQATGITYRFDRCALIRALVMRRLMCCGASLQKIRRTIKSLRPLDVANAIDRGEFPVLFCPVDGRVMTVHYSAAEVIERAACERGACVIVPITAAMRCLIREQLTFDEAQAVPRATGATA